jgi:hypothetical protein
MIMMARFNSAGADIAQSYLLITILAAILGGIDPYGGFGGVGGNVLLERRAALPRSPTPSRKSCPLRRSTGHKKVRDELFLGCRLPG